MYTFLDVVIGKSSTILKLLASKDQTLLIRWDTLLVLDLGFDIFNSVRRLDFKRDSLTRQGFDEDLHVACQKETFM